MRIGYSFWGFLGPGVLDTPDGGRSHRRTLVEGLIGRGHHVIFLQANRDLDEAGHDLRGRYTWDLGLPDLDLLFLEWRWSIAGRNTTPCDVVGHTCDLHRQRQLLQHYTANGVRILLWDKDRRLPPGDPLRTARGVAVLEPALYPTPGAVRLLFPVADDPLDRGLTTADELAGLRRDLPLVYVGNQHDRDAAFDRYLAPAAAQVPHRVAGKWTRTGRWPHARFTGRIALPDVDPLYRRALATVLLLPDRYAAAGQMTQRLFEAVLAGCLPIAPATIRGAEHFTPAELHAADGAAVLRLVQQAQAIAGGREHAELIRGCLRKLDLFRLSRQLDVLDQVLGADP
jgi:hypothetical protein